MNRICDHCEVYLVPGQSEIGTCFRCERVQNPPLWCLQAFRLVAVAVDYAKVSLGITEKFEPEEATATP